MLKKTVVIIQQQKIVCFVLLLYLVVVCPVRETRWRLLKVSQDQCKTKAPYTSLFLTSSLASNMAARTLVQRVCRSYGRALHWTLRVDVRCDGREFDLDWVCVFATGRWCTPESWSLRNEPCRLRWREGSTASIRKSDLWPLYHSHIHCCYL